MSRDSAPRFFPPAIAQFFDDRAAVKEVWIDKHRRWNERDLSTKHYVYVWAYGIHLQARLEDAECLKKDRETPLASYNFPAEHWKHFRTTNPIESTFATVRHRTIRSKGYTSRIRPHS